MEERKKPEIVDIGVVEQLTRGEVEMQVSTANRYPRSIDTFKKRAIDLAAKDTETAQSCFYVLPRGGRKIEGPSIRLAEIVATSYKNLRCETRVVGEGEKTITAQATVWDMEHNVLVRCETSRRITGKDGRRYSDDMVIMTGNAASSIALRNAIFKMVPFAHVKPIFEKCKKVALGGKGVDQIKGEWLTVFEKAGISNERVLAMLEKKHIDDLTLEDITTLQGVYTALSEGQTTVDQVFPPERPKNGTHGFGFKKGQKAGGNEPDGARGKGTGGGGKKQPAKPKPPKAKKTPDVTEKAVHPDKMPDSDEGKDEPPPPSDDDVPF
jgi:hypothetical protein